MKKIISVFLAVLVVTMCFSACSKNNEPKNEEMRLDVKYTYDSIYSDYDESSKRTYNELCDAIINHNDEVKFNIAMLDDVLQLVYTSFPFSYLTDNIEKNDDSTGVKITYKFEKDEHDEKIKQFNDKIVEIEKQCGFGQVIDSVYILKAYNYVASNMNISENSVTTLFETVMNDEGSIFTYANLFEYLLLQKDIMAFHIIAEDIAGTGWALSSAQLNGEVYYFDMATEHYNNGGENIIYFALNSMDVENEGLHNLKYTSGNEAFISDAKDFSACRTSKTWSLESNTIHITQYDLSEKDIELK